MSIIVTRGPFAHVSTTFRADGEAAYVFVAPSADGVGIVEATVIPARYESTVRATVDRFAANRVRRLAAVGFADTGGPKGAGDPHVLPASADYALRNWNARLDAILARAAAILDLEIGA